MDTSEVSTKTRKSYRLRTVNGRKKKLPAHLQAKQDAAREKQEQALELRKAGATYKEISQALGFYDASAAKRAVDRAMERNVIENSREIILLDLQRLDELQKRLMAQLRNKNDLSQVDRILRVMQQRYALAGIGEETAREVREAMGITQQITQNNTALVIQVNPNSEEAFIRKMMAAAGASSETIENYVEEKLAPPKAIEPGKKKKKVVRRRRKGVSSKTPIDPMGTEEVLDRAKVQIKERDGVRDLAYKDSIITNRDDYTTYGSINEEEIIDAEVID